MAATPYSPKTEEGWFAGGSVRRNQAEHLYQAWAIDFQSDATAEGLRLKFLNVFDQHIRLCFAIRVG